MAKAKKKTTKKTSVSKKKATKKVAKKAAKKVAKKAAKKVTKKATKKVAKKAPAKKAAKKVAKKATKKVAKKAPAKKATKKVAKKAPVKKVAKKVATKKVAKKAPAKKEAPKKETPKKAAPAKKVAEKKTPAPKKEAVKAQVKKAKQEQAAPEAEEVSDVKTALLRDEKIEEKLNAMSLADLAALDPDAFDEEDEDEVILTDADGRAYCKVKDCDELSIVEGYCRFHYISLWKRIQARKKILAGGKLDRYIEELTARYPDKYLEMLRKDLATEKDFMAVVHDLEIEDGNVDGEFEEDDKDYINEVRGINTGGNSDDDNSGDY